MSNFDRLTPRLERGRPLVLDADSGASMRARGLQVDTPGALGLLLRERPAEVARHYAAEVLSAVDILSALTGDTTPRALAEVGMEHRAALLTGIAVELAFEAAAASSKPVAVAGVLGSEMVSPLSSERLMVEFREHAERLASAECELLIARGQGSRLGLMSAVVAAAETGLPTWAVIQVRAQAILEGEALELLEALKRAGASAVLLEVSGAELAQARLEPLQRVREDQDLALGVLLAASPESVRGFAEVGGELRTWASRALSLGSVGCRIIGGGAGTTEAHTRSLAMALGSLPPGPPPPVSPAPAPMGDMLG